MFAEIIKTFPAVLLISFIIDAIIGDPKWLPHPVKIIGRLILFLDGKFNSNGNNNRLLIFKGILNLLIIVGLAGIISGALLYVFFKISIWLGIAVEIIMSTCCIAAHDLIKHAINVYNERYDIAKARISVGMIVGRETSNLSEHSVIKATIESIAESLNDGVIAPALYILFFGPIGGLIYKSINTMDSMIGYHNEKYEYYGKPAAISDDIVNFIPSRLSAICIIAAAFVCNVLYKISRGRAACLNMNYREAYRIWHRDRRKHSSPNSAQTESAMAGALELRLGGPAVYSGKTVDKPFIGEETATEAEWNDIKRAGTLMYVSALIFLISAVCVYWLIFSLVIR